MEGVRLMCTQKRKNQIKDNVEKEGKKELYVLEGELGCRKEKVTEERLHTHDIAYFRSTSDCTRQNNK